MRTIVTANMTRRTKPVPRRMARREPKKAPVKMHTAMAMADKVRRGGHGLFGKPQGVGTHIGDKTQRALACHIHTFVQLLGGCLAAGFLFHSLDNGEVKGFRKVGKAVMEGDELPALQLFLLS